MQRGSIYKKHGAWYVVYRADEVVDGKTVRKQKTHRLVDASEEYRTAKSVETLAQDHLRALNLGTVTPQSSVTVAEFAEKEFLPYVKQWNKPSTLKFYTDIVDNHITPVLGSFQLREVTPGDIQDLLNDRSTRLSHTSILRLKTGCSALLRVAIEKKFLTVNPAREARARGKRSEFKGYAYNLEEVFWMLERLPELCCVAVAVAAFSGLRKSEMRGLRWPDYDGKDFHVRTSIWRTHEGGTKTEKSASSVPVIEQLRKILAVHKQKPGTNTESWIFAGEKMGRPLNLDNLARREMKPILGERWHGWHAFRRGLVTILWGLKVPVEVASIILRHESVEVTRKHYLMLESKAEGNAAMKKLQRKVRQLLDRQASRKR